MLEEENERLRAAALYAAGVLTLVAKGFIPPDVNEALDKLGAALAGPAKGGE